MFILTLDNGTVIAKASAIENRDGYVYNVDEALIYGFPVNAIEVEEIPEDFQPYKYFYNEEEGFVEDGNFVDPKENNGEAQLERALARIEELENAVCELSMLLEEGLA